MAQIPEYNKIGYKNDSRLVIYAKGEAIKRADRNVLAGKGINAPTVKPKNKDDAQIPDYNKIDYENDSLLVIAVKEKINGVQEQSTSISTKTISSTNSMSSVTKSAAANEKTRQEKLKEAEARKKKRDKEYQEKTALAKKNSDEAAENVQKYIADQVKQSTEKKAQTVSSAEALKDMQSSVKNIWQGIVSPVSNSLNQAVDHVKSDEAAKQLVDEIRNGAQGIGKIEDFIKGGKDGFSEKELLKLSTKALLGLQQDILSQNMTHQAVLDGIAKRIAEQSGNIEKLAKSITEQHLMQKAYINAYLKNTFGNPEFMNKVSREIEGKVTTYIDTLSNEKINMVSERIDSEIDNTFSRVTNSIDSTTNRINTKLDDLLKLDIVNDINNRLEKSVSLEAFEKRLNANPLTQIFAPSIMAICQAGQIYVINSFKQPKMLETIKKVQDKMKVVQDNLKKAKDLIANKTKMLKEYVDTLKQKATEAVKQFANKVISDIKSKISVAIGNAIGGAISGLAAGF